MPALQHLVRCFSHPKDAPIRVAIVIYQAVVAQLGLQDFDIVRRAEITKNADRRDTEFGNLELPIVLPHAFVPAGHRFH